MAWCRLWLSGVLCLVGVWLVGVNQGFPRTDTGLYAGLSRWAYSDGFDRWWFLTGPNEDYFNKPPLAFWAHGAFAWLTDATGLAGGAPSMWVLRLPTLVAACVCVIATVGIARALAGHRVAWLAGVVLALSLEFFRYTKAISLDVWIAMFAMLAVWAVVRARTRWRWILCGACMGLGLMVKPWLMLMPMMLLGGWVVTMDGWRATRGWGLGAGAMIAVALPWHGSMWVRYGERWSDEYIGGQAVARITSDAHGREPWWYYAQELATWHWPWLLFVALAAVAAARGRFARDRGLVWLAGIWTIVWLIALSAST